MTDNKDCLAVRKIKTCKDCCRYNDCNNKTRTLFVFDKGCIELGYDILISNSILFKTAWKRGYVGTIEYLRGYFRSQTPTILTAEQANGIFILESLESVCLQEFGTLESCHAKLENKIKAKIKDLEDKWKNTTSRKKKFEIMNKINEAKGELNF